MNKWNRSFERDLKVYNALLCIFLLIFITLASLGWMKYFQTKKQLKELNQNVDIMFRTEGTITIE